MSFRIRNDAYQLFGLFYRMGWILIFEFPYWKTTEVLTEVDSRTNPGTVGRTPFVEACSEAEIWEKGNDRK